MSGVSDTRSLVFTKAEWGHALLNNTSLYFLPQSPLIITDVDEDICKQGIDAQESNQDLKPSIASLFNRSISPFQKDFKYICKVPPKITFSPEEKSFKMTPSSPLELRSTLPWRRINFETFIWDAIHSDKSSTIEMEPHQILWLDDIRLKDLPSDQAEKIKKLKQLLKFDLPLTHKLKIICDGELSIQPLISRNIEKGLALKCSNDFIIELYEAP